MGQRATPAFVVVAIGGIYIPQTMVSALAFTSLPVVLRSEGMGLAQIGLVWLVMLPWLLKFTWSGAVERGRVTRAGRRRSRLIVVSGQLAIAALLVLLARQHLDDLAALLLLLLAVAVLASTVDIACDAFAVEQLRRRHRGWGNTAQVGGSYLGLAIGGGLFLYLFERVGWTAAVLALAAIIIALCLPFLGAREAPRVPRSDQRPNLGAALVRPEIRLGIVITIVVDLAGRLAAPMTGPFLIDAALSAGDVGIIAGLGGSFAGLVGTVVGGFLFRALGEVSALRLVLVAQTVILTGLAITATLPTASPLAPAALVVGLKLVSGATFVVLFATLMGFASLDQAGVDFTLFQCMSAGVAIAGGSLAGVIAGAWGFTACFGLAAAAALSATLIVPHLCRRGLRLTEAGLG